jgi:hypothetical protein
MFAGVETKIFVFVFSRKFRFSRKNLPKCCENFCENFGKKFRIRENFRFREIFRENFRFCENFSRKISIWNADPDSGAT